MKRASLRWLVGIALLVLLGWRHTSRCYPLLPGAIELRLALPAGTAGATFPLVTTGATGAGDLLFVRYLEPTTVVFGYDSWAVGGPISEPIGIVPGAARRLLIELPSLSAPPRVDRKARGPLRIAWEGREVLGGQVHYYGRQPDEVYFALNPLGGTVAAPALPGEIQTSAGRRLRGRPSALLPWPVRLRHWITTQPGSVAATLAAALAAGWLLTTGMRRFGRFLDQPRPEPQFAGHARAPHGTFALTAAVGTAGFAAVLTGFSFQLFAPESFGQFYDYQIASLLQGRLDVPEAALGAESFVYGGKYYGYFGPTPALLRLPFAVGGVGFGRLSRSLMLLYYAGALAAVYALLVHAARQLSRRATWPARGAVVLVVGSAALGSTLFFLGSRAYIYHEAILGGVLFALWSVYGSLRWLAEPSRRRWWLLALAGGCLSIHARPPTGLFALVVLGLTAAAVLLRSLPTPAPRAAGDRDLPPWPLPVAVGLLAVAGVLSFNLLSYLKFRSFDGAPLRYHVQYHPERLAVTDGRNFHAANLPFGLATYGWRPSLHLQPTFPYLFLRSSDPADHPGCRIDLAEHTLGLPYAMPALLALSVLAAAASLGQWPAARLPLGILCGGLLPMALALVAAIAVSHRYTGDFVPFLLASGAFGAVALDLQPRSLRRNLSVLVSVLMLAGMFTTFAITLHYQGERVWGVPDETRARYQSLRRHVDHFLGFPSP